MNYGWKFLLIMIIGGMTWGAAMTAAPSAGAKAKLASGSVVVESGKDEIRVKSGNVIILADGKDVDRLLAALKQESPAPAPEPATLHTPAGLWNIIKAKAQEVWRHLAGVQAFSLKNFYYLLGGIFATFLLVAGLRWLLEHMLIRRLARRTNTDLDDRLCFAILTPLATAAYALGFYLSAVNMLLDSPKRIQEISIMLLTSVLAGSVAWGIYRCVDVVCEVLGRYTRRTDSKMDDMLLMLLRKTLKVVVVVVSVLLIGQNILGINITTLLAGAGIFGLAVAFAAQDTIANFFGSIMIIMDKPFFVGDRIKVADYDGIVKSVGFRSIRLETLDGHVITLPNKKIVESAVENITVRPYIKFVMNMTPTYDTSPDKMRRAMALLHEILDGHEGMDQEHQPLVFFDSFNDWALNIKVIVWYFPGDWGKAMAWLSETNLQILQRFNDEHIDFAFPSNTTYLVNDGDKKFQINLNQDAK
ncbi:MAG: mechanosensitive ion channel family protein [Victivallales bacterium]|nr:mechanosensitive ion channel family protein [Victivallales bacterium]